MEINFSDEKGKLFNNDILEKLFFVISYLGVLIS